MEEGTTDTRVVEAAISVCPPPPTKSQGPLPRAGLDSLEPMGWAHSPPPAFPCSPGLLGPKRPIFKGARVGPASQDPKSAPPSPQRGVCLLCTAHAFRVPFH